MKKRKILCFVLLSALIAGLIIPNSVTTAASSDSKTETTIHPEYVFCNTQEAAQRIKVNYDVAKNKNTEISFHADKAGKYYVAFTYAVQSNENDNATFLFSISGAEEKQVSLRKLWKNDGAKRVDGFGDEFSAKQKLVDESITDYLRENKENEFVNTVLELGADANNILISDSNCNFNIEEILLFEVKETEKFDSASVEQKQIYDGIPYILEGEDAAFKSSKSLIALADSSAGVTPSSSESSVLNYIGSSNWKDVGDTISWVLDAPETGFYKVTFRYRQEEIINGNAYRNLYIDGMMPNTDCEGIRFEYSRDWDDLVLRDEKGNDVLIYLEKGQHMLSLEVSAGEMGEVSSVLQEQTRKIGDIYRKIVMITGEQVDTSRDYNLFEQIPDFNESLQEIHTALTETIEHIKKITGKESNSSISTIQTMCIAIKEMLDNPYTAHEYKSIYYSAYCSLSSYVYEMIELPLDIDQIVLSSADYNHSDSKSGVFDKAFYSIKRFLYSFVQDYSSMSGNTGDYEKSITLWINCGRDQAQVLNNLISTDFSPKSGIGVNVKLTNATAIQGILSGNGPDCMLNLERSTPINLAMRGALYNLEEFDDYEEAVSKLQESSITPYEYQDGTYALPDTRTFYMMFYRTDIFEEMNLEVPKTWDEFLEVTAILQRNNLQSGIGNGDVNLFTTMIKQNGGSLYTEDKKTINLDDPISIDTFKQWCGYYLDYSMPKTSDYYNRFRTGIMPLMIQTYTMYNTLKSAASEIDGKWAMVPIPGTLMEDGTINNAQSASGTGCVILDDSEHKEEAWEFLKWWISAETQYSYSENVETILGPSGRVSVSNVEAIKMLTWDDESLANLMQQWEKLDDYPEIPGGYYISRSITQAYLNVINNGENPTEMLQKWGNVAKDEIERKRSQYNLD